MKKIVLFLFLCISSFISASGQTAPVLDGISFTSRRISVRQMRSVTSNCYKFYKNGVELIKNTDYTFVFFYVPGDERGGVYHIDVEFGFFKPGDQVYVKDICRNETSKIINVTDDFVYIEVPPVNGSPGNGIDSNSTFSPYDNLTKPVDVGKCTPVPINSHVLFGASISVGTEPTPTFRTGVFKINGVLFNSSLFDVSFGGYTNTTYSINSDGSFSSDGFIGFDTKIKHSGASPLTIEYTHNGFADQTDFGISIGGMQVRFIKNGSFQVDKRNYLGQLDTQVFTGNYSNANYKILFNENKYELYVNGNLISSLDRFVVYDTNGGTLSTSGSVQYRTPITFTPQNSGKKYITALFDGAVNAFQYFNVAEDMTINESITNVGCFGESTGSITVNVSGGHGTKTYSKDGTTYQTSNVLSGLAAGNYTIYVKDASGCTAQKAVSVTQNAVLSISATPSNANCVGENNGSINVSASGGAGFYQFKLGSGGTYSTSSNFPNLGADTYTVFVKDAAGCEKSTSVIIGTNSTLAATTSITPIDCFGAATGQIVVNQTGTANGTVQYSLNDVNYQTTNTFSGLSANTYTVYVKDNSCKVVLSGRVVSQNSEINLSDISKVNVACNGESNGSIAIKPTGGTSNYLYSLDGATYTTTPEASHAFTGKAAGNYKVWVKDAKGCIKESGIITITQPNALTASVTSKVDLLCNGTSTGSATITAAEGTSPYRYAISGNTLTPNATISALAAGAYNFTIQDAKNCTTTATTTILQPTAIVVSSSVTSIVSCFGGSNGVITATASGGTGALTFSKDSTTYQSSPTFVGLATGNFKISAKDANNCVVAAPALAMTEEAKIVLTISNQKNVLCFGGNTGEVTLAASGGVGEFTYSKDSLTFVNSVVFSGLIKDSYKFYVKDKNDCVISKSTSITEPEVLIVSLAKTQDVLCFAGNSGKITTTISGGTSPYQYALDAGAYTNETVALSHLIDTLKVGTYQVKVRDANGCEKTTNQITLIQPTELVVSISSQTNVNCFGENTGIVTLGATNNTGGYVYKIENEDFQANATYPSLTSGTYNFTVRDANGCEKPITTTITQPTAAYTISLASTTNLSCYQNQSGEIKVTNAGGTGPYQLSIDNTNFQTPTTFGGLSAIAYTVYGKDALNCPFSLSVPALTQPTDISISLLSKLDVNCDGYVRGNAVLIATGSNNGFSYTLNGSDFSFSSVSSITNTNGKFDSLKAGDYVITATDQRSCAKNYPLTIDSKSSNIDFDITKTLPTSCLSTDGVINVLTPIGGRPPFEYSISSQNTFSTATTFNNLRNGNYIVTVKDSLCSVKKEVDLKLPNSINAGYTISPISCQTSEANVVIAPITGANGNYQISKNGEPYSTNTNFTNLTPNVYAFTVRDSPLSCETVLSIEIKEQNRADMEFTNRTNILCFGNNTGQISVQGNNNMNPFTYALNNGGYGSSGTFANLTAGTYKIYTKNRIGCIDSLQATLTQPTLLVNSTTKADNLCFGDNSGQLVVAPSGGVTPYEYSINNTTYQTTATFQGLTAGNYTTYLKDAHGCITPKAITLLQPTDVIVNPQYIDTVRCFGESNGKVQVIASGGTPNYQFSKDGTSYFGSDIFSNLPKGNYTFFVKDANQCVRKKDLNLTEPTLLELALVNKTNPLCFESKDGTIQVNAKGGNGGNGFTVTNVLSQSNGNFTGLGQNNYVATVTDRRGCVATVSGIELLHPTALKHSFSTVMPLCYGDKNGKVTVVVADGTPAYNMKIDGNTYSPQSDGKTFIFDQVPSRTFLFTTVDKNGCLDPFTVELNQPSPLKNRVVMTQNKCFGDSTGVLELFGNGATPPYNYSILNGYNLEDTTFRATNYYAKLLSKTYNVRIKDANACRFDTLVTVAQPTKVQFKPVYADTVRCFGEANGKVKIIAQGGTPSYVYSLDNKLFQPQDTLKGLKAGVYSFFVKDQNNCSADVFKDFNVTQPKELQLSLASQSNPLCLGEKNGTIKLSVEGGNGGFTFIRDNSFKQDSLRFTDLSQGEYTFKVTDRRACEDTVTSVRLKWPKGLTASVTPFSPTCFGDTNGKIEVIASGGVGEYKTFLENTKDAIFDSKTSKAVFKDLTAGSYTVAISDANGCQVISPATILEADKLNSKINLGGELRTSDSVVVCKGQFVTLNAQNQGKEIRWFRNNIELPIYNDKNTIDNDTVGVYKVIVKNATGCAVSDSFALKNNNKALRADFLIPTQAFVGDTVVCLDITKPIPDRVVWGLPPPLNPNFIGNDRVNFIPTQADIFTISMIVFNGECKGIVKREIKIFDKADSDLTDSVYQYSKNKLLNLNVFPNPNYGNFNVVVELKKLTNYKIRVFRNTTGEMVYSKEIYPSSLKNEEYISLNLFTGIYLLRVDTETEGLSKLIVIQQY